MRVKIRVCDCEKLFGQVTLNSDVLVGKIHGFAKLCTFFLTDKESLSPVDKHHR